MKTLALVVTLILHASGLWPHISDHARANLTSAATIGHAVPADQTIQTLPANPVSLPVRINATGLDTDAASALAVDTASGTILYAKNAADRRPIASITKLVTALVILSRHNLDEVATVPQLPEYGPDDERIGLIAGETYTIRQLLQAALIQSANDAADALALYDAGTKSKFAARMNLKMSEWGVSGTRFSNPTGLFDNDNYASAEALSKIARLALTNPFIRETTAKRSATITSGAGRSLYLSTTNDLLASGQFYGIKTGYTPAAGECFVGLTRIDGHEVITVVLGANDRFGATRALTNWIGQTYQWL